MTQQQELAREQYQRALEQQASQQDVLVRLVENQRDEMERCREEMYAMRRREADAAAKPKLPKPTSQKLGDKEDIENFLSSFERIAIQQQWPENVLSTQLAGLLTGKALSACAAKDSADSSASQCWNSPSSFLSGKEEGGRVVWVCRTTDHFDNG